MEPTSVALSRFAYRAQSASWECAKHSPPCTIALCLRRELRKVVEADLLLKLGYLGDALLETVVAEMLVLALLHLFADGIELMAGDDVAELWKQYGVLARCVRPVHR